MSNLLPLSVGLIDCGIANLGSMVRILGELVNKVTVVTSPKDLAKADKLILPGVGAFPIAMQRLTECELVESIKELAIGDKKPILGVCLGMQLLASTGHEFEQTDGLGLIPGSVKRFVNTSKEFRIPHVGWNSVLFDQTSPLIDGIRDSTDFYFVHSYVYELPDDKHLIGHANHGVDFPAIVSSENIYGTQFHPEKSSVAGFTLIKNFCGL